MNILKLLVKHPATNILVGLILIFTSLQELWESLGEDIANASFGAHHGLFIYGLLHTLRAFSEVFEGLDFVERGEERD